MSACHKTHTPPKPRSRSQLGASLVEYALLISLIAVVAILAVRVFGAAVSTEYSEINSELEAAW